MEFSPEFWIEIASICCAFGLIIAALWVYDR